MLREDVAPVEADRAKEPPWSREPRTESTMRRDMEVVRTAAIEVTMVRMGSEESVGLMINQKRTLVMLTIQIAYGE